MISIIVAVAKGGAIGKEGKMPWKIPGEQRQFKDLTTGHVVVMGRTSYEE
ncbi:dihydrofolate reductase, partial [uncultured Oribacterium sp.]